VRAMVRPSARMDEPGWPASGVDPFPADLRSARHLEHAFEGVDVLIHLAAAVTGPEDAQFASTVVGTERLLGAMAQTGCRRVVLARGCAVYRWGRIQRTRDDDSTVES